MESKSNQNTIHAQILKNLNLKVGDTVKVTHVVPNYNLGWKAPWHGAMDLAVDKVFTVKAITDYGVTLDTSNGTYAFPAQCLEVVERVSETIVVQLNSEYKAKVYKSGLVEVGCQKIDIAAVKQVLKAYNKLNETEPTIENLCVKGSEKLAKWCEKNAPGFDGSTDFYYYFINKKGEFDYLGSKPKGYKVVSFDEWYNEVAIHYNSTK